MRHLSVWTVALQGGSGCEGRDKVQDRSLLCMLQRHPICKNLVVQNSELEWYDCPSTEWPEAECLRLPLPSLNLILAREWMGHVTMMAASVSPSWLCRLKVGPSSPEGSASSTPLHPFTPSTHSSVGLHLVPPKAPTGAVPFSPLPARLLLIK